LQLEAGLLMQMIPLQRDPPGSSFDAVFLSSLLMSFSDCRTPKEDTSIIPILLQLLPPLTRCLSTGLTAQHSTAQHSTAQHSTAQHSTAQHSNSNSTAPFGLKY